VRNERHWKSVQESPLGLSRDVLLEQCSSDSTGLGSGSTNETAPAAQGQCVGFQTLHISLDTVTTIWNFTRRM
jgi:hypothetical protein